MKRYLLSITTMFVLMSCSASRTVLSPDYKNVEINGKSLSVLIDFTNLTISNEDDIIDDLGEGEAEELYKLFLKDNLITNLKYESTFKEISLETNLQPELLEQTILKITDKENVTIKLPKNNIVNKSIYDFTLFIENITIGNKYRPAENYTRKMLLHTMDYAIWDNNLSKVVSYGFLEIETEEFIPVITKATWKASIKSISTEIISSSPFKRNRNNYN